MNQDQLNGDTEDSSQVVTVLNWDSILDTVNQNTAAIKQLQDLPNSISELKALMAHLVTGNEGDEEPIYESDNERGPLLNEVDDLQDTVKSLLATKTSVANQTESASVQEILNQTQTEPDYGPNLREDVASSFGRFIQKKTNKDCIDSWKESYKAPDNCKTLGTPRVNHEIWAVLPNKAKQTDIHWQALQTFVSMTSVALAQMAEKIVGEGSQLPGKWQEELLQMTLQCASINNVTNQTIISQRKKDMKPFVSEEAAVLCSSNNTTTELLFGNDFQDEIKASKSALTAVKLKAPKANLYRKDLRYTPFRKFSGNGQVPPSRQGVRGGQRPRRFFRRQYGHQQSSRPQSYTQHSQ